MSYSLTELTLVISVPLLLGLTVAAWRFRDNPGAKLFGALEALSAVWAALAVVGLQLPPGALRLQLWGLNNGMSMVVIVFWFAFILSYTGRRDLITPRQFGVVSVPLAIGAGLYFVAPSWSPLVGQIEQTSSYIGTLVQPSIGPVGNVLGLYIYVVFLAGIGLVIKSIFEGNSLFVGQGLALVIGSFVTVVASFFGIIGVPFEGYPATEVALAGVSVFWGYAVFAQQFLQAVPAVAAIGERAVFDELDDGVVVVDEGETVIRANPAARSYLDLDEIADHTVEPLLDRMDVSSVTDLPTRFQTRGQTYRAKTSPITDWRGEFIGQTIIVQDITSLNRRQQRLQVLNRILRHNVRNDMNLVLGMSSQLQERSEERLSTIGESISQRVDNLIDISEKAVEIDNIFDEATVKHVDLGAVIEEVTSPLAAQYPTANVSTDVSADTVHTDPEILSLVVGELLTNALEHTGDAPTVTVDVSRPSDRVQISVTDDGPGIPRIEIDPILTGEETDLEHASSLGLWLVYWGAQSLEGELDITTTADGTTATVTIPNMESTEAPPSQ